jgi:hypothetical protein
VSPKPRPTPDASATRPAGDQRFWDEVAPRYVTFLAATLPVFAAVVRSSSSSQWRDDVTMLRGAGLLVGQLQGAPSALLTSLALLVPGGPAHFRGALVSAIFVGVCGALLVRIVRRLTAVGGATPLVQLVLSLVASLTLTLSPTLQAEATVAGGSTLALAAALGLVAMTLDEAAFETPTRVQFGALFGVLLAESPPAAGAVALSVAAHAVLTRHRLRSQIAAPALLPLLAGFLGAVAIALGGFFLRPLAPSLWVDVGRGLSFGGLAPLDVESLRVRALASWMNDVGVFPLLTGTVGAALVVLRPSLRTLGLPLLLLVLPDLIVPAHRGTALAVDPLLPLRAVAIASFSVLGAVALQTILLALERSRLPFSRGVGILLVAFSFAILAIASEEATQRVDRSAARSVEVFTDEALERLPPRAVVLVRRDVTAYRLWAARLVRGQRPDVTVIPLPLLTRGRVAQRALAEEPASAALLRDISARGTPSEYALSTLADARPLYVELDPTWDRALASHTVPEHLWLRFSSQPLAPSDRKTSQQAQDTARTRVRGAAISGDEETGGYPDLSSEGTIEVLSTRAREEVAVAALLGDGESTRRSLSALAELRAADAFVVAARAHLTASRRPFDLRGMLRSGKLDHQHLHVVQKVSGGFHDHSHRRSPVRHRARPRHSRPVRHGLFQGPEGQAAGQVGRREDRQRACRRRGARHGLGQRHDVRVQRRQGHRDDPGRRAPHRHVHRRQRGREQEQAQRGLHPRERRHRRGLLHARRRGQSAQVGHRQRAHRHARPLALSSRLRHASSAPSSPRSRSASARRGHGSRVDPLVAGISS